MKRITGKRRTGKRKAGNSGQQGELVGVLAALADETRLRLLNLMHGREVCVCYFVEILGQSQPKISRHLAYLRKAGIVAARRDGKWMHYRMTAPRDGGAAAVLNAALESVAGKREMRADVARLERASCAPQQFVTLEGVPKPRGAAR